MTADFQREESAILFYDGECGVCSRLVQFAMPRTLDADLLFAPLQGQTAMDLVEEEYRHDLSTVIMYHEGEVYYKSEAIFKLSTMMGGIWALAPIFRIIPRPIRDYLYDAFARIRHRVMPYKDTCRLPTAEESQRFLA